jgi:RNA-directed DNA polymerase
MSTVDQQPMYEWKALPWKRIERRVFKLQKRIYQASRRGDVKTVHRLQKLLMHSWSAKCLATRRVTQDNQGKKTAGVDGVKSLTPPQRLDLVKQLNGGRKAQPVRRVWIPKPGTCERRGLGIPVMYDRAHQALVKLALEPEWEAKFEANSYGFRPGRGCHDALAAIYINIVQKPKYVLDADIAKCFDRINHQALLEKLATFPQLRRIIAAWLKAGVMDEETLFPTTEGTPQGGVISPLLANVALHGLETAVKKAFPKSVRQNGKRIIYGQPLVIRYADDFVVLHPDLTVIQHAQQVIAAWLAPLGLELKASKTHITHTLHPHENHVGFDFLGCTIRQYPVGKTHSGRQSGPGSPLLGYKTLIKPSQTALHRHIMKTKEVIRRHRSSPQALLIKTLNPIIRGWANYHATNCAKRLFTQADTILLAQLLSWATGRHPDKSVHWAVRQYWQTQPPHWVFTTTQGQTLLRHADTPIHRHIKVKGQRTPFDGDWLYWATRLGKSPDLPKRTAFLLKRQRGRCAVCGLFFRYDDVLEVDHILPTQQGGQHKATNWQLLHRHCHDQKGTHDKSHIFEEPDDGKLSRPVLKPSGGGDPVA